MHSPTDPIDHSPRLSRPICIHPVTPEEWISVLRVHVQFKSESFARRVMNDLTLADLIFQPYCISARRFLPGCPLSRKLSKAK